MIKLRLDEIDKLKEIVSDKLYRHVEDTLGLTLKVVSEKIQDLDDNCVLEYSKLIDEELVLRYKSIVLFRAITNKETDGVYLTRFIVTSLRDDAVWGFSRFNSKMTKFKLNLNAGRPCINYIYDDKDHLYRINKDGLEERVKELA